MSIHPTGEEYRSHQDSHGPRGKGTKIVIGTVKKVNQDLRPAFISPTLPGTVNVSGQVSDLGFAGSGTAQLLPRYSVDVKLDMGPFLQDVPYMTPYSGGGVGDGIYFVPREGTRVLAAFPEGDPDQAYVLGWVVPPESGGGYGSGRIALSPGDMAMRSAGGGVLHMYNGGVIVVESSPTSRRTYVPRGENGGRIRDHSSNYSVVTAGGDMIWTKSQDNKFTTLRIMASIDANARNAKYEGDLPFAGIQMGSHNVPEKQEADMVDFVPDRPMGDDKLVMTLTANDKANIFFDKDGNIVLTGLGKFGIFTGQSDHSGAQVPTDDIHLETPGTMKIKTTGDITLESAGRVYVDVPTFTTTGKTKLAFGGLGVVREYIDNIYVFGVESGGSVAKGWAFEGSSQVEAG